MRVLKLSVVLLAFVLLSDLNLLQAVPADPSLSGRLIFENGDFSCDQCTVSLMSMGTRPIATAYVDLSGHFTFSNVPRGAYTIRVEIDGFEDVNQRIETYESAFETNLIVRLVRKRTSPATGANVVNLSEFLDRYPKKA